MDIITGTYQVTITATRKQFAGRLAKLKKISRDALYYDSSSKTWEVTIEDPKSLDAHHLSELSDWDGIDITAGAAESYL